MSSKSDFIEVPPPLYKYRGEDKIHDDNLRIIEAAEKDKLSILPDGVVKKARAKLRAIHKTLQSLDAERLIDEFQSLVQTYNSGKIALENGDESDALTQRLAELHTKLTELRTNPNLVRARQLIRQRERIKTKLQNHFVAVQEEKKEKQLSQEMAQEAEIIATQIQRTLSRLGFSHTYTVGKQTRTDMVRFAKAIVTPDQIQLKIAASRRGIAGGTVDLMPQGVRVTEILQEYVMRELSAVLEREVWTPHINEDVPNATGAWLVIERLGLYEGIPKLVSYRQIMARYETADHERIPLPLGLKRGNRINWTYLDSHSSTHVMFTGITGSGKTNTIQAAISAILEKQSPDDVIFVFVDLKNQGDFKELSDAPHIVKHNGKGVITEIPDVVHVLSQVRAEMHWRQKRIGAVGKNITQYNRRVNKEDRLPRIIVLFDEYANTRRARFKEEADAIDDICTEITQVGRASGIHLWIGIQQPRATNMPQSLRDNFTTLFIGHQASVGAAQSVTGNRTSLKLANIPGRMLAYVGWQSFEVQMPFITDDDIMGAVRTAKHAYGDNELYQLHYGDNDAQDEINIQTSRDVILEVCFEKFDGALKAMQIYYELQPRYSQSEVRQIVKDILEEGVIEWQGVRYTPVKQRGNFYRYEILS